MSEHESGRTVEWVRAHGQRGVVDAGTRPQYEADKSGYSLALASRSSKLALSSSQSPKVLTQSDGLRTTAMSDRYRHLLRDEQTYKALSSRAGIDGPPPQHARMLQPDNYYERVAAYPIPSAPFAEERARVDTRYGATQLVSPSSTLLPTRSGTPYTTVVQNSRSSQRPSRSADLSRHSHVRADSVVVVPSTLSVLGRIAAQAPVNTPGYPPNATLHRRHQKSLRASQLAPANGSGSKHLPAPYGPMDHNQSTGSSDQEPSISRSTRRRRNSGGDGLKEIHARKRIPDGVAKSQGAVHQAKLCPPSTEPRKRVPTKPQDRSRRTQSSLPFPTRTELQRSRRPSPTDVLTPYFPSKPPYGMAPASQAQLEEVLRDAEKRFAAEGSKTKTRRKRGFSASWGLVGSKSRSGVSKAQTTSGDDSTNFKARIRHLATSAPDSSRSGHLASKQDSVHASVRRDSFVQTHLTEKGAQLPVYHQASSTSRHQLPFAPISQRMRRDAQNQHQSTASIAQPPPIPTVPTARMNRPLPSPPSDSSHEQLKSSRKSRSAIDRLWKGEWVGQGIKRLRRHSTT